MVRFRKLNGGIWGNESKEQDEDDFDFPIDEDEQDKMIENLERRNYKDRETTMQLLCMIYLLCAGIFLIMATKAKSRDIASMLLGGVQSIVCSWITLRYNLVNNYCIFKKWNICVNGRNINFLNYAVLILLLWISWNEYEGQRLLQLLFQIPLLLQITAIVMKRWSLELDQEFDSLRNLKYKYKNA